MSDVGSSARDQAGVVEQISASPAAAPAKEIDADQIERLPSEMKTAMTVMAGLFRSTSGPDPETARLMAESEMHAEKCKLEAYRASLANKDSQNQRDHDFRRKKLDHDTIRASVISCVSVAGIICALYLMIAKGNSQVGTPLLVASFMTLLGYKPESKDKD
jgi:hypothetical protein